MLPEPARWKRALLEFKDEGENDDEKAGGTPALPGFNTRECGKRPAIR